MTEPPAPAVRRLQELVGSVSSVVAPLTLVSTVLFYFGYVYTRELYAFFGLDVDTIGLGTQEFIMRSPSPLLTPLLLAGLLAAGIAVVHAALRRRIAAATDAPGRLQGFARLARGVAIGGWSLLGSGVVLVGAFAWLRDVPGYGVATPAALALGSGLAAYATKLGALLRRPARTATRIALYGLLTVALLWTTATLAQAIARGSAVALTQRLDTLPAVVLDTRERLYLVSPGVDERVLPAAPDQQYRYRYRNLRLLIQGKDRLFLVPATWSAQGATLVVAMDGMRVQFPFRGA